MEPVLTKYIREPNSYTLDFFLKHEGYQGLKKALGLIRDLRELYWRDVRVTGTNEEPNQALEKAGRVADFFELAELMCIDALHREESAGGHFRVEYQTPDGEAERNDDEFLYVAAWEHKGVGNEPVLHKEPLVSALLLTTRIFPTLFTSTMQPLLLLPVI